MAGAERLPDAAQILVLALELEGRGAPENPQARHLGKRGRDLLGHSVGEEVLIRIMREIEEREYRDGDTGNGRRGQTHTWCGFRGDFRRRLHKNVEEQRPNNEQDRYDRQFRPRYPATST